jgi:hypothetical protein
MKKLLILWVLAILTILMDSKNVLALPPADEIPEEILRTEIFTEARSPIDGKPVSAAEYAQLEAQLETAPPPRLDSRVRHTIFLLRVRNFFRKIIPFW